MIKKECVEMIKDELQNEVCAIFRFSAIWYIHNPKESRNTNFTL